MVVRRILSGALVLIALVCIPARAQADWLFSPFIGASLGGDTEGQHLTYGASIGYMGARVIGFEFDFGYTPEFFEGDDDDFDFVDSSNVTTAMANVILGIPIGDETGVRPYVTGGAGLLRTNLGDADDILDLTDNSFGVNVGAGLYGFLTENVGLRGDVRYFRNLQDTDDGEDLDIDFGGLNFWRATLGVAFRF